MKWFHRNPFNLIPSNCESVPFGGIWHILLLVRSGPEPLVQLHSVLSFSTRISRQKFSTSISLPNETCHGSQCLTGKFVKKVSGECFIDFCALSTLCVVARRVSSWYRKIETDLAIRSGFHGSRSLPVESRAFVWVDGCLLFLRRFFVYVRTFEIFELLDDHFNLAKTDEASKFCGTFLLKEFVKMISTGIVDGKRSDSNF